ncbi:MAG: DUF3052 domain-containing protein [Acidobacteria bacterium]|nr:MAG: DUF3052 domain-containing protein [Acidobacteriota bacterium]
MAGYSGTPLPKKLGIKERARVALLDVPAEVQAELTEALSSCELPNTSRVLDFVFLFSKKRSELTKEFSRMAKRLAPAGVLWVAWPKKTSGVHTDLNENEVRRIGLQAGLVDVKVCAVDEVWSGLKFVIRVKDRAARP